MEVKMTQQLKDPQAFARMMKKYGPGFVALSKKSGRVVAHAKKFGKLWDEVKDRESFKDNKLKIMHVPDFESRSAYYESNSAY